MIKVPSLKNATLCRLYQDIILGADPSTGNVILDHDFLFDVFHITGESSLLRRMIIDLCIWRVDGETLFAQYPLNPLEPDMYMEALRTMSKRLMSKNGMTNPLLNLANYDEPILEEEG